LHEDRDIAIAEVRARLFAQPIAHAFTMLLRAAERIRALGTVGRAATLAGVAICSW
jgi:hypothetical protein